VRALQGPSLSTILSSTQNVDSARVASLGPGLDLNSARGHSSNTDMLKPTRTMELPDLPERIQAEIDWASDLSQWLRSNLTERFFITEDGIRRRAAMAFCNITLDHREALIALAGLDARSSLNTLARSMLDAVVRAIWCRAIARPEVVRRLIDGDHHVTVKGMLADLKKAGMPYTEGLQGVYSMLSDYAHGEARQLSRWIASAAIEPTHRDSEVIECLGLANHLGMMAAVEREKIAEAGKVEQFRLKTVEVMQRIQDNNAMSRTLRES
jgi:hypothetical protein